MKLRGKFVLAGAALSLLTAVAVSRQLPKTRQSGVALPAGYDSEVKIEEKDGFRYITANGIPDHAVGRFPGPGNPNRISPQSYSFKVPLKPTPSVRRSRGELFGVALNGVVFDPGTAERWNGDNRWRYEALTGLMGSQGALGADDSLAHVQPNGAYHYHGMPLGFLKKRDYKNKMVQVGWAADGYPIYGPNVPSDPKDLRSPLKAVKSAYRLKSGDRPGGDGPGGAFDGSFLSDYEFAPGGDLDECNGRTGVTPEFPGGTYYYVLTETWPFIPRQYHGTPDPSFQKGPGGPGGGPPGQGGGGRATVKASGKFVYVLQGNTLYKYSADGLTLLEKTEVEGARPAPPPESPSGEALSTNGAVQSITLE